MRYEITKWIEYPVLKEIVTRTDDLKEAKKICLDLVLDNVKILDIEIHDTKTNETFLVKI